MDSVIFHVDVNSAFLSWEAAYRIHHLGGSLDIRNIPSAVGGSIEARHGIILAKSIPAKKYGITTGMPVTEARSKCPDLYFVPPNYTLYQKCSKAFKEILREYTPHVEEYSIDEAFMDMSSTYKLFGNSPLEVAKIIKNRIKSELGFTVNVGISSNKLLAKMAGEFNKPDNANTLYPEEVVEKMWPLQVGELFYVGRATKRKLLNLGITTIGQLAAADVGFLRQHLKMQGELVWAYANGIDNSCVQTSTMEQKGYGNSTTISFDVDNFETAQIVLLGLSETVAARLRKDNVEANVIAVGIKSFDLSYQSHQMQIPNPTNITKEIFQYACQLFNDQWDKRPIRHLSIHTSRVKTDSGIRQMNFFETDDYQKLKCWDTTVDRVRGRYGNDSLKRAPFIKRKVDHMEGGISREKRKLDYKSLKVE